MQYVPFVASEYAKQNKHLVNSQSLEKPQISKGYMHACVLLFISSLASIQAMN